MLKGEIKVNRQKKNEYIIKSSKLYVWDKILEEPAGKADMKEDYISPLFFLL